MDRDRFRRGAGGLHVLTLVRRVVAAAGAAAVLLVLAAASAVADVPPGCTVDVVTQPDGSKEYVVTCPPEPGGSETGGSGTGTGGEPTCELTGLAEYCIGASACWANVPSALDPSTWPEETRPSPDAIYTYQSCRPDPDGTLSGWSWYTPDEMTVGQAARQAFGLLAAPAFTVGFSPPGRAIVSVPTWFWAQGASAAPITGSSALGVVAIGEPAHLEVDPGDGSGTLTCPWQTAADGECAYTYARSSVDGSASADGLPAYEVRMRLVYDVRFEINGTPLTLGGLPSALESPWREVAVPVAEIQTVVTPSTGG